MRENSERDRGNGVTQLFAYGTTDGMNEVNSKKGPNLPPLGSSMRCVTDPLIQ
jgi:hypothetical protein